jgi:hypothetical protein
MLHISSWTSMKDLQTQSHVLDPDPGTGRQKLSVRKKEEISCLKSSLLGWRLVQESECSL